MGIPPVSFSLGIWIPRSSHRFYFLLPGLSTILQPLKHESVPFLFFDLSEFPGLPLCRRGTGKSGGAV
jgi:hypothetical protein